MKTMRTHFRKPITIPPAIAGRERLRAYAIPGNARLVLVQKIRWLSRDVFEPEREIICTSEELESCCRILLSWGTLAASGQGVLFEASNVRSVLSGDCKGRAIPLPLWLEKWKGRDVTPWTFAAAQAAREDKLGRA